MSLKIIYIGKNGDMAVSTDMTADMGADSTDCGTIRSLISKYSIGCTDDFAGFLSEIDDILGHDGDAGIVDTFENGKAVEFIFDKSSYYNVWGVQYLIIRNDSDNDLPVMTYDGSSRFAHRNSITVWDKGSLVDQFQVYDFPEPTDDELAVADSLLTSPLSELDRLVSAYRSGTRNAMVKNEVARFGRIWTDECQAVNGGNMAPIMNLFLATVDSDVKPVVQDAILAKYRKK